MAETRHATCVALQSRAVLIFGGSGQGKSTLGLQLMAFGCELVADDQTILNAQDGALWASSPDTLQGIIEAHGFGILTAKVAAQAKVVLAVDLDRTETARMPPSREFTILGCTLPLIYRNEGPQFAPAILQILKTGWSNR